MIKINVFTIVFIVCFISQAQAEDPYQIKTEISPKTPTIKTPESSFSIIITPKAPWVLKMKTPLTIKLSASANLDIAKTTLGKKDVINPKSPAKELRTRFNATQPGKHFISTNASFFLCTPQICKRFTSEFQTNLNIRSE